MAICRLDSWYPLVCCSGESCYRRSVVFSAEVMNNLFWNSCRTHLLPVWRLNLSASPFGSAPAYGSKVGPPPVLYIDGLKHTASTCFLHTLFPRLASVDKKKVCLNSDGNRPRLMVPTIPVCIWMGRPFRAITERKADPSTSLPSAARSG